MRRAGRVGFDKMAEMKEMQQSRGSPVGSPPRCHEWLSGCVEGSCRSLLGWATKGFAC